MEFCHMENQEIHIIAIDDDVFIQNDHMYTVVDFYRFPTYRQINT
jgi:hypothetical protein